MPIRVWFGDEYVDFADGTPDDYIQRIADDYYRYGSLGAVKHKEAIKGLATNQDFLSLPRIERHNVFNKMALAGPLWQMLEPDERRAIRDAIVNQAEGANKQETLSYWDSPIRRSELDIWDKFEIAGKMGWFPGGKSQLAQDVYGTIAEVGRGIKRRLAPTATQGVAGITNIVDSMAGYLESNPVVPSPGPMPGFYTNPLFATDEASKLREATGDLAESARETMIDASVGSELMTAERRYKTIQEGWKEAGIGGVMQWGGAAVGEQVPVVGAITAASAVPGIGPALGVGMAASLQTGSILEDLERQGITGDDARTMASVLGVVTGAMEYLPIGHLLNRSPIVADTWKRWLIRKGAQTLAQGGEEAITEGMQTWVEEAAADFVKKYRGELDNIPAWQTKDGFTETFGNALNSAVEGGFIGLLMGPFGGGRGQVQPSDLPESGERVAQTEVQRAREILRELEAQRAGVAPLGAPEEVAGGPRVPPMEPMEPTETAAPPEPVAPSGGQGALPLPFGEGGAAIIPGRGWTEEAEQRARKMYAPDFLKLRPDLLEAFITGDIDNDVFEQMVEHGAENGMTRQEVQDEIIQRTDRAFAFLRGGLMQPEQEPLAEVPREELPGPPVAPGQTRRLDEGLGVPETARGPGERPAGFPAAPPARVPPQGAQRRLGEGLEPEPGVAAAPVPPPEAGEVPAPTEEAPAPGPPQGRIEPPDVQMGKPLEDITAGDMVEIAELPKPRRKDWRGELYDWEDNYIGNIYKTNKGFEVFKTKEHGRGELVAKLPAVFVAQDFDPLTTLDLGYAKVNRYRLKKRPELKGGGAGQPPEVEAAAAPEAQQVRPAFKGDRRAVRRSREMDKAVTSMYQIQRQQGLDEDTVRRLIGRLERGESVMNAYAAEPAIRENLKSTEIFQAALDMEDAVFRRGIEEKVRLEVQAEMAGEEGVTVPLEGTTLPKADPLLKEAHLRAQEANRKFIRKLQKEQPYLTGEAFAEAVGNNFRVELQKARKQLGLPPIEGITETGAVIKKGEKAPAPTEKPPTQKPKPKVEVEEQEPRTFAERNIPILNKRIEELELALVDTEAYLALGEYAEEFPIPTEGGLRAAWRSEEYAKNPEYRAWVDAQIESIEDTIRLAHRQRAILRGGKAHGVFYLDYMSEGGEKAFAEYQADAVRGWTAMAVQQYGSSYLGDIAIREVIQNSVDAAMEAIENGDIKRGKIEIETIGGDEKTGEMGTGYVVRDNGPGMSDTDIAEKFLVLHGTGKAKPGRFGGFGIAKAVILKMVESARWILKTRDNYLTSQMTEAKERIGTLGEPVEGTEIRVETDEHIMSSDAIKYAETTETGGAIDIIFNGKKVKNPFENLEPDMTRAAEEVTPTTTYQMTVYLKPPKGYEGRKIIRLVDPETGIKLTQGISTIYRGEFKGAIIIDITTQEVPGTPNYPLNGARTDTSWRSNTPVERIIDAVAGVAGEFLKGGDVKRNVKKLSERSEWARVLKRLAVNKDYQRLEKVIDEIWDELEYEFGLERPNESVLPPLDELEIWITEGYEGPRPANIFTAMLLRAYQQLSKMIAERQSIALDSFHAVLEDGTYGHYGTARGERVMGVNPAMIDKTALKDPWSLYQYIADIISHELAHYYVNGHNENFTQAMFRIQRETSDMLKYIMRVSEAIMDAEAAMTPAQRAKIPVQDILEKYLGADQLKFIYDAEEGAYIGGYDVELYYPNTDGSTKSRRQLPLFRRGVDPGDAGQPGEAAAPTDRGRGEQPDTSGAPGREPRRLPTREGAAEGAGGEVGIDEAKRVKFHARIKDRGVKKEIVTPDGEMSTVVQYVLVDSEHILPSHKANLEPEPDYPAALQPRARDRAAYKAQIEKIKNDFKPELVAESTISDTGAPIVGSDGIVESGNGRVIAIKRMYDENHPNSVVYKKWLVANAERFGLDKRKLMGMRAPILVRERLGTENRVEFAQKSNAPSTQTMSPIEQARMDAGRITDEMMAAFDPGESLNINAASNNEFVSLFMKTLPDTERGALILEDGSGLNELGIKRVKNAVLVKAYGDQPLLEKIVEDESNQVKRVAAAMMKAAPKVIKVQSGINEGLHPAELDTVPELMEAVSMIQKLREEGKDPQVYLAERQLFGEDLSPVGRMILEKFVEPKIARSGVKMADMIERYYGFVERETFTEQQPALDLGVQAATKEYIWQQVFDGKSADQDTLFSLSKDRKGSKGIRVAHIHQAFKGWSVNQVRPGLFRIMRKGQPVVHLMFTQRTPTKAEIEAAAKGYDLTFEEARAGILAGRLVVKGSYTHDEVSGAHVIALYSPNADVETVFHEAFHFVFHNILTEDQRKVMLRAFKNEEAAARAYQRYAVKQTKQPSGIQKIFDAIRHWARQLLDANAVEIEAAERLMSKIASGEVFSQEGRFYQRTDPSGIIPLKRTVNTIWDAQDMVKEAKSAKRLRFDQFPAAVEQARDLAGHQFIPRGTGATMFSMEVPDDVPEGHHPGTVFPADSTTEIFKQWAEERIFNRIAPIRVVQEKLTEVGQQLQEMFDAYLKAQNFQARAGALLDWVETNLFKPFEDALAASGISLEDFDLARMAAHALERNPKIEQAWVGVPLHLAEAKIKRLSQRKLTKGTKVRALDRGNTGTILDIDPESGMANVRFYNPKTGFPKDVRMHASKLERESIAKAKDDIAEIRRMVDAGEVPHSGIPTEDAKAILEEFRTLGLISWEGELKADTVFTGKIGELFKPFQQMIRWKEDTLYKAGLLSAAELKKWRDYKYYAPMRGKAPDIMDIIAGGRRMPIPAIEAYGGKMHHRMLQRFAKAIGIERPIHQPTTGRGYNPGRRPASHRALGRRSFPKHSATIELMTDVMEAAVRAEKNRVAKTVWNLVNRFKDAVDQNGEKLWEIDRPDSRLVWDEKTGTVKTRIDGLSVMKDNVYHVWIDGELHYIRHVSPEMAEFVSALNNLHQPKEMAAFFKGASAVNRYIAKMATGLNPAFVIPNFVRDAITAGIKIAGEKQFEGFGLATMAQAPESWATLKEYARRRRKGTLDKMDPKKRKRVEAFKLAGGETAFWMIPDIARQLRTVQGKLVKARGDDPLALQAGKYMIHAIEDYNQAVEATMRFAVFERALEMGISEDKAGRLARNITVDFTQQGGLANVMGSFYVFANASLQGSAMVAKAVVKNKPVQKMMLATVAAGFGHALLSRIAGGNDEDDDVPYWDKVTAYEKSRNIVLLNPWGEGERLKIPLPWGFNVFWNLGQVLADMAFGPKTPEQAFWNIMSSAMSAFNPIGDNDLSTPKGFVQMLSPSWFDPITDIALNQTFWGGPIRPESGKYKKSEQYGIPSPNYNKYFSGASEGSKWATKLIYKGLGIDVSPEDVDYGIGAVFGGLGDTVNRAVSLLLAPITKKRSLVARDFPIVKSFYADETNFFVSEQYRANMGDFYLKQEIFKELEKTDPKAAHEFRKRHWEILRMEDMVKETEKRVRELKKQGVTARDSRLQREFKMFNRFFNRAEKEKVKRRIRER